MGERIVRLVLGLYPEGFRARYRDAVLDAFRRDRRRARRAGRSRLAFWYRTFQDLVSVLLRAWGERLGWPATGAKGRATARTDADGGTRTGASSAHEGSRAGPGNAQEGSRAGASGGSAGSGTPRAPITVAGTGSGGLGGGFRTDLTHAFRGLARRPGVALVAALTLGLGIGLTTTIYSVMDGLMLRGLPVENGAEVLSVRRARPLYGPDSRMHNTVHDFLDLRERQTTLEGLAGWSGASVSLSGEAGGARSVAGAALTTNAFEVLHVGPLLGRGFEPADGRAGADPVVVLGHGLWQERFGADPDIVDRMVRLDGQPTRVIGVMPEGFQFPFNHRLWVPLTLDRAVPRGEGPGLFPFGRLRDGVSVGEARAEFRLLGRQLAEEYPETDGDVMMVVDTWGRDFIQSRGRQGLWIALGTAGLVLLVACLNVSNLLLARAAAQRRELAVRAALGAGRWRMARLVLMDAVAVAAVGTALGIGLSALGIRLFDTTVLESMPGGRPWYVDLGLHPTVLLFSLSLLGGSALIAALVPALQVSRTRVADVLEAHASRASSLRIGRMSRALVVIQVALACALLVGAGLLGRSMGNVRGLDLGLDPDTLFTARIGLPEHDYPDAATRSRFWSRLLEELAATDRLGKAALADDLPLTGARAVRYRIAGHESEAAERPLRAHLAAVSSGYLDTVGVSLMRGRGLSSADSADAPPVALVSESLARSLGGEALGRRLLLESATGEREPVTVVGVVPRTYVPFPGELRAPGTDAIFVPLAQRPATAAYVLIRQSDDPLAVTSTVRDIVAGLDPDLPLDRPRTLRDVVVDSNRFVETFGRLFVFFGGATLFLAAVGLYGVMSFVVRQRTREVGIRLALGAGPRAVMRLMLLQGLRRVGVGLAIGLLLALGFGRLLAGMLFTVNPADPWVLAGIAAVLVVTGILATWVPARRACRLDPLTTLRAE